MDEPPAGHRRSENASTVAPGAPDVILRGGRHMDNYQARGYVILALAELGYKYDEIDRITWRMHQLFDLLTEEEAEEKGQATLRRLQAEAFGESKRRF
jgi:hypothetical protein